MNRTPQRRPSLEKRATEQLRALTNRYRLRLRVDSEGLPVIPGRYGQIEWFDGADLAVYTDRPRLFTRLWAIPGVRPHQTGDTEMRAVFPPDALAQVAAVIRARRRRTQASLRSLQNLRPRTSSRATEVRLPHEAGDGNGSVDPGPASAGGPIQ